MGVRRRRASLGLLTQMYWEAGEMWIADRDADHGWRA
jgi:hypothetical protein